MPGKECHVMDERVGDDLHRDGRPVHQVAFGWLLDREGLEAHKVESHGLGPARMCRANRRTPTPSHSSNVTCQ